MLSPELQAGLRGLESYNAELFGGRERTLPEPPTKPARRAKHKR
jgi:hypothetical protein